MFRACYVFRPVLAPLSRRSLTRAKGHDCLAGRLRRVHRRHFPTVSHDRIHSQSAGTSPQTRLRRRVPCLLEEAQRPVRCSLRDRSVVPTRTQVSYAASHLSACFCAGGCPGQGASRGTRSASHSRRFGGLVSPGLPPHDLRPNARAQSRCSLALEEFCVQPTRGRGHGLSSAGPPGLDLPKVRFLHSKERPPAGSMQRVASATTRR